jgi:NADPH:quinone reductase-like Zn-dependent oxidoreductase
MKAIQILRHGGHEALERVDLPEAVAGSGQVLIEVEAVGLNHLDVWVRRGVPGHRFPLPLIPGSDVVGRRLDTGERVALQPGLGCMACARCLGGEHSLCRRYRIRGETMDGGMVERMAASEAELLPCPLPPEQAAALPLALLTAWHMLLSRAQVGPGQRVLVQAGASGVGSLAIQIARLAGARVVATASTPGKRELCRSLGAELAWGPDELAEGIRDWTGKEGVDIAVDHVGAATFASSIASLRRGGTYVTCGATAGHEVPLNLRLLFFKQLSLLGSTMGGMGELREAWSLVLSGALRPVLEEALPMSRLQEAHGRLESRGVSGKLVVTQDLG